MLDLSTISFKVDTSELDRAGKAIGELVTNVGKLDKAARDAAQTEVVFAKAAKLNADANLQNAKAQDTRLKSTITADKADQQAAAAIERKTKATERASTAIKKNADMLQLQNDTYDFILEGFSKGDAKVLAMAKATGQLSDQLKQVLTDIRQFSKNTFDQTETGLDRMVKSAKEANSAQGFLNNGLNLTSKQAKELSNDLDRLNIRLQHQGKSYQEITKEQAIYKQRFVEEANAVNRATSALAAVEKQRKDVVSATNYLTQAEAKMVAALNTSNAALDKAGTDSLVKYESALRKSGVSQDVATLKLAKYKAQLEQVQIQEQKRREEHLTRALAPQATDIVVSLWSGQNPLTVLLQQGGQVTDLFMQSGIAAEKFGEVVKSSMKSMLPSILTVVKAVGGLLVDGFVAAGNAVSSFLAKSVGMAGALDKLYMKMSENGPSKWGGAIRGLSSLLTGVFAAGVAAAVAVLVSLGIGLKQVIEENDNLARSMALSGASMAISTAQAFAYAKSMNDVDISTGEAVVAITEMAKAGNFASSDITKVTEAAVNLNKYLGVSIEDTVKGYSKLKDEPVKAILDLAKASGNIPPEIIKTIVELERQGEVAKATSIAMTARFENDKKVIEDAKKNLSGFSTFVIKLGDTISNFFSNTFKNIWYATDPTDELQKNLDEVRKKIKDVSATLESNKSWGISGDPKLLNSLKEQERMIISQIGAQVRLRGEEEKRKFLNAENAKDQEAIAKIQKESFAFASKETEKTLSLEAFKKKFVDDKIKATGRQVELDKQTLDLLNKQAEAEYKKLHASGAKQTVKDLETEIDILNKRVGLTSSYNNELASLQRLRASGVITEQEYVHDVEELIKLQPFYIDQQKKVAEGQDLINKLLGKGEGLGKDYYDSMAKLEALKGTPGFDTKEIEAAQKALSDTIPFAKAMAEWFAKGREALEKYSAEFKKTRDDLSIQSDELDYQYSLLGKTEDQQKKITIEHQRRVKLLKAANEYEAERLKILNDKNIKNDEDRTAVMLQNDQAYAEKVRLINRETALVYAQDLQKEFDAIKNGISDSIVTALFEGGKAGSKKFRDLVVAELKKPVTMVVNAVVNTVLGNTLGSLMGGSAAGGVAGASGLSSLSSLGSLWNAGSSALSSIGSFLGFGGAAATGLGLTASAGAGLGLASAGGGLGLSLGGTGLGISAGSAGAGAIGGSLGSSLGAGAASSGSAMASIGAAMPWIAGAAALYSIISGFDDSGTYHTGGASRYSRSGGITSGNSGAAFDIGFGQVETGKETISAMETLSKSLVEIFDGIAKTFGKTAGYEVAVAFADDTSKDGAWGAFAVRLQGVEILNWDDFRQSKWAPKEFGDGEEGYKQYLAAITKDTRQVILDMDLPEWADQVLNDIGDAPSLESLSKAIQELAQMKSMYDLMTSQMVNFAGITDEAFGKLIKEFGDIGTMTNQVAGYYQNYYSEFERFNKAQADVTKSFTDLGLTMPTSREEFRKLAESQDLNTEAGRKMYAQLMALAASFGVVIDATEQLANARTDIVYRMMEQEALLLEAQGRTVEADQKRRELLDKQRGAEYERLMKINSELARLTTELWALEDAATAAATASNLRAGLISLESMFTGGGFSKQYKAEDAAKEVNSLLSSVGINKDVATITSALLNSTTNEVEGYFREIWEVLDTDEARLRLVEVSNVMLDIATATETAAEKFQKQSDNLSKLATEVSSLFAARNSAGSLLDKIAGAMGNQGSFAAQREGELWNALGSTSDYKKQVELASQLTDIVLQRQQLEVQNAERLLSFGQGLRDYVNGLKLSDLSPLTNAEKLAEASKQYSETLSKAIGGDANAQSELQSISSSYLELARTYYAGNEQFSSIFNSVTSALDTLGINSMTESQQQIAIGNQSLEELQKLYGITETAYEALNTQYENSLSQLIAAQDALVLQASSLEQLVSISNLLTNLPAEIAVRLPTVNTELNPLNFSNAGVTSASSNAELLEELKMLRIQVAKLEASNREDARMQADVFVGASQATSDSIASATTKAARAAELKQGATIK